MNDKIPGITFGIGVLLLICSGIMSLALKILGDTKTSNWNTVWWILGIGIGLLVLSVVIFLVSLFSDHN